MSLQYEAAKYAAKKAKQGAQKTSKFAKKNQKSIVTVAGMGILGYLAYKMIKNKSGNATDSTITDIEAISETGVEETVSRSTVESIAYETSAKYSAELQAEIALYNDAIAEISQNEKQILELKAIIADLTTEINSLTTTYNEKIADRDNYALVVTDKRAVYLDWETKLAAAQTAKLRAEQAITDNNRMISIYESEIDELRDLLLKQQFSSYWDKWKNLVGESYFGKYIWGLSSPVRCETTIHNNSVLRDAAQTKDVTLEASLLSANSAYSSTLSSRNAAYNVFKAAESEYDGYVSAASNYYNNYIAPLVTQRTAEQSRLNTYQIAYDAINTKIAEMKAALQSEGVDI